MNTAYLTALSKRLGMPNLLQLLDFDAAGAVGVLQEHASRAMWLAHQEPMLNWRGRRLNLDRAHPEEVLDFLAESAVDVDVLGALAT